MGFFKRFKKVQSIEPEPQIINIETYALPKLEPGDLMVIKCPAGLHSTEQQSLGEQASAFAGASGARSIILPENYYVEVIRGLLKVDSGNGNKGGNNKPNNP